MPLQLRLFARKRDFNTVFMSAQNKPPRYIELFGHFQTSQNQHLISGILRDVTHKQKEELQLRQASTVFKTTSEAILVLDEAGKKAYHIDHERSGDLVVIADADSWFTYYFWLDDAKAPDYARCVDIHRKPGYDPVELVLDPAIKIPILKIGSKVLKKKLGFRYLMDVIPLDATLVKGAHGRIPESDLDKPLVVGDSRLITLGKIQPTEIFELIIKSVRG